MYLYKGSPKLHKSLLPEVAHSSDLEKLRTNDILTNSVVWATNSLPHAEIFALFGTKVSFELHKGYGLNPTLQRNAHFYKVSIEETEWESKIDFEEECFVYMFDSAKFIRLDTGEYISTKKATPITTIRYKRKDLLVKLIKNPLVEIYAIEIYSYKKLVEPNIG